MPAAALPVLVRLLPGLALCVAVALAASAVAVVEARLFGQAWLEPLVLAILLGAAVRSLWPPPKRCRPGIDLAAHRVLEAAVVLMGAAVGSAALAGLGPSLLAAIAVLVAVSIAGGYGLCRLFGLAPRLALLVACGNSICGNSAIAAVAPVIRAEGREVASAVAFTAVLGVAVVLLLPLAAPAFGLTPQQYGVLAGLTVYAVPQVLAAAAPLGVASIQVATVVKLVRVLMLGPVVLTFALADRRRAAGRNRTGAEAPTRRPPLVPWFIVGFLALMGLNLLGLIPPAAAEAGAGLAGALTVVAMAGLGLSVDVRTVARAGLRVSAAVTLSLLALGGLALLLVRLVVPA